MSANRVRTIINMSSGESFITPPSPATSYMVAGPGIQHSRSSTRFFDPHVSLHKFIIPLSGFSDPHERLPPGFALISLGEGYSHPYAALYLGRKAMDVFRRMVMFRGVEALALARKVDLAQATTVANLEQSHVAIMHEEATRTNWGDRVSVPVMLNSKSDWTQFLNGEKPSIFHEEEELEVEHQGTLEPTLRAAEEGALRAAYQTQLHTPVHPRWASYPPEAVNRHLIKLAVPVPTIPPLFSAQDPVGMGRRFLDAVRSLSYWAYQHPDLVDKVSSFNAAHRYGFMAR